MRKVLPLFLITVSLLGCSDNSGGDLHRSILQKDLKHVTYGNGIDRIEAKTIAEAYLFVYGGKATGPAPRVYIHDGGKFWRADIAGGTAIHPHMTDLPPVHVAKANGDVTWVKGPSVHRVDLSLAPKKNYFDPAAIPSGDR